MKEQIRTIRFLQEHEGKWIIFAKNQQTVQIVCALHNLGIAEVKGDQMILKSREKAKRWLDSFEE